MIVITSIFLLLLYPVYCMVVLPPWCMHAAYAGTDNAADCQPALMCAAAHAQLAAIQ